MSWVRTLSMTPLDGAALVAALMLLLMAAACGGQIFGKVYEYDEDLYVSLDGSAELIVNASIPALVTLRGLDLPLDPGVRFDTDRIRSAYASPLTEVTRVSRPWRRQERRFVQVRLRMKDIRRLSEVAPFSWSTYELAEKEGLAVYRQHIAGSAMRPGTLRTSAGREANWWRSAFTCQAGSSGTTPEISKRMTRAISRAGTSCRGNSS